MTNNQRRTSISQLNDQLFPLKQEKMMKSLRYNFLTNPYRQHLTEEEGQEVAQLEQEISELNEQIDPLFEEMRAIQIRYVVEYDGEVISGGLLTSVPNKKIFYLSTDVAIDSYRQTPNLADLDVQALFHEISNYIYYQEYSRFTLQHVKRLPS